MPLLFESENEIHVVSYLRGDEKTRKQLMHLGFIKNTPVYIKSADRGSLIVQIRGSVLALDRKMASRILVERSMA